MRKELTFDVPTSIAPKVAATFEAVGVEPYEGFVSFGEDRTLFTFGFEIAPEHEQRWGEWADAYRENVHELVSQVIVLAALGRDGLLTFNTSDLVLATPRAGSNLAT